MNVIEKVYCVYDYWDMTIIKGIAEYNHKVYYFNNIFSDEADDWTDIYRLTLLDNYIFKLSLENWDYWKEWLKGFNKKSFEIPHPVEYAEKREILTADEIFNNKNIGKYLIELTEKYYQNEIIINEYLKNSKHEYIANGYFIGKINGMDTKVKWENIIKI